MIAYKLMIRLAKIQVLGPLVVLLAVGAAEGSAFALAKFPTSETLWYLNLKIFAAFQTSYYSLSWALDLPYGQFFLMALIPFAVAIIGLVLNHRFLLALGSHLGFVAAGFLVNCGVSGTPGALTASLVGVAVPTGPHVLVPLMLAAACLVSLLVSQSQYIIRFFRTHTSPGTSF